MIYLPVDPGAEIRQGDIWRALPRIDFSLDHFVTVNDVVEGALSLHETSWRELSGDTRPHNALVTVQSVMAIVISQDCDASRATDISVCEIVTFASMFGSGGLPASAVKWASLITQKTRENAKWFYLPPDPGFGLSDRMAVDFMTVHRFDREQLLKLRGTHRVGRLNNEADEHFRERLSDFFRRYPVDEWYPLNREEFAAYKTKAPEAAPRPYQG